MELKVRKGGAAAVMVALTAALLLVLVPEVLAVRYIVGSGGLGGWAPNVNYTNWTSDKHFYSDDWLFFVYDRNQQNVLEVNQTDYESCNSDHPVHNWTTGAGRDVVPLNKTGKTFYFISGKGFCFSGMKLAVHVEKHPAPTTTPTPVAPVAAPVASPPAVVATPPAAAPVSALPTAVPPPVSSPPVPAPVSAPPPATGAPGPSLSSESPGPSALGDNSRGEKMMVGSLVLGLGGMLGCLLI